uniref:Uncharacterized protein n=1 Tax=Caenorhabditis japonica TaxID=281687 RepID=A0A8R1IC37_CAEJA
MEIIPLHYGAQVGLYDDDNEAHGRTATDYAGQDFDECYDGFHRANFPGSISLIFPVLSRFFIELFVPVPSTYFCRFHRGKNLQNRQADGKVMRRHRPVGEICFHSISGYYCVAKTSQSRSCLAAMVSPRSARIR